MDNKNNDFVDLTNGSPEKSGQPYGGYQPVEKRGEFRINAAIQPKTFNRIVIAVAAGSAAVGLFVVVKLLSLFFGLF